MHKYMHIRACDDELNILPAGGLTIAYTLSEELQGIFFNIARCHPKDLFSRKLGRELASHRLKTEGPFEILPFQHPIASTIRCYIASEFGMVIECDEKGRWISDFINWEDETSNEGEILMDTSNIFDYKPSG